MPENSSRKLTIGLLFLLTFAISVAAVYIGIRLSSQPTEAPVSIEAADGDNPVCISDTFESGSEPDGTIWAYEANHDGTASVENGVLSLVVPANSNTDELPRYSRLSSIASFSSSFRLEVNVTALSETSLGTSEEHIASVGFPYLSGSSNEDEVYKVDAFITNDGTDSVIELKGYIGTNSSSVQLPLTTLSSTSSLKLIVERESQIGANDLVTISYNVGTLDEAIITQEVSVNIVDPRSVYIEVTSNDDFESSASFDNFEVQCGGPVITTQPTPTEVVSDTVSPTSVPIHTITPTVELVPSTMITPTTVIADGPTNTPVATLPFSSPIPTTTPVALPQTAIISEDTDRLIFSILLILAGFGVFTYAKKNHLN